MPTYRIQTSLQDVSHLPRDQYVNTFHVAVPHPMTIAEQTMLQGEVPAFYQNMATYLSSAIADNGHTMKTYLVGAPLETPPVFTHTFGLSPAPGTGQTCLPNEVACCVSYHADPQPSIQRQSWRGRFYLGPLNASTLGGVGSTGGKPTVAFRDAVAAKAAQMFNNIRGFTPGLGLSDVTPVVYSRLHSAVYPINNVSVDDEWDTMRSRGLRATAKSVVVLANPGGPAGPA